jgi:hypothetical protein
MVEQNNNQKGFSALIAIVAILVIAGAGLGGWYVLNQNDDTKKTNTSQNTKQDAGQDEEEQVADPSEGGKYVALNELGVRFPIPNEYKDDVLTLVVPDEPFVGAYFASKKLNAMTNGSCGFIKQPDGSYSPSTEISLHRFDSSAKASDTSEYFRSNLTLIKDVGGYIYYWAKPEKPEINCVSTDSQEGSSVYLEQFQDMLGTAFQKIEKL